MYKFTVALLVFFINVVSYAQNFELKNIGNKKMQQIQALPMSKETKISLQSWAVSKKLVTQMLSAKVNESIVLKTFPLKAISDDKLEKIPESIVLTRRALFAPSSKIYKMTKNGAVEIAKPRSLFFSSHQHGIGIMLDPLTGEINGLFNKLGVNLDIKGNINTGVSLTIPQDAYQDVQAQQQCLMKMANQPKESLIKSQLRQKSLVNKQFRGTATIQYQATIAIETDNMWMQGKNNSTTDAMAFISELFVRMNVFYERDFATHLLVGDVFLRPSTTPDPYTDGTQITQRLSDFGAFWLANMSAIDRQFALMLSGDSISGGSFSGIAWLNIYCNNGFLNGGGPDTAGSYSVNRIGSSAPVSFVAQFVGHELGHNLGSAHTHCYNAPIDNCYNLEGGCYAGAVSCPTGGNARGSIMSYCHFPTGSGGAQCGLNNEVFHPTVINLINANLAQEAMDGCIIPFAEPVIFINGFEAP